jgi:hypothetical protein
MILLCILINVAVLTVRLLSKNSLIEMSEKRVVKRAYPRPGISTNTMYLASSMFERDDITR